MRVAALHSRRYLAALVPATLLAAVATGIPTDLLPNPWFTRMTPVRTLDVVLWPILSIAIGALLATYALPRCADRPSALSGGAGGGVLSVFAIGCPVCNKLVVLALGFSGALAYFAPIQPLIGLASLLLTLGVLRARLRTFADSCNAGALNAMGSGAPASAQAGSGRLPNS